MIEDVWGEILSEEESRILSVLEQLSQSEQKYVMEHLARMTSEEGWHPAQIKSASFALETININRTNGNLT